MAKEYTRTQRIGDQMQRELALLIQREIKDPRLGHVTLTQSTVLHQNSSNRSATLIKARLNYYTTTWSRRCCSQIKNFSLQKNGF